MNLLVRGWIATVASIAALATLLAAAEPARKEGSAMSFVLSSPAFITGAAIPSRHTCDADDLSPELRWTDPPAATKSLALIVDDPDAPGGTWVHWVVYDLPASARSLPEGVTASATLEAHGGAKQGKNDFRKIGWGGPCPPPGKPHRYFFRLYALDAPVGLPPGASKAGVERAIEGHVVGQVELVGTYVRK